MILLVLIPHFTNIMNVSFFLIRVTKKRQLTIDTQGQDRPLFIRLKQVTP